jgi:glycosyltransferase involved in cell wall biosynthesis
MFVRSKKTEDDAIREFNPPMDFWSRLRRRIRRELIERAFKRYQESRPERAELFYDDRTPHNGDVLSRCPSADVLHLHSVYGFLDHGAFFRTVSRPVVWTLHDMNAFTGGCQYNVGCRRFEASCGKCPQLGSGDEDDLSRRIWMRKREAYRHVIDEERLQVVCPSQWMAEEAKQSSLVADLPVEVVPNGVDAQTFRPRDAGGMRVALGIPSDHRIALFLASSTERTRKGFDLLDAALGTLSAEKTTLVSVGGGAPKLSTSQPHVHLGHVDSDLLLSAFYNMADLFVIPSRQDNLPNTVLESMACGTPVVGFEVGGIPDMIRPGETGWLVKPESPRPLRNAMEQALADKEKRGRMATRCRKVVEEEYTLEVQARNYRRLYRRLLRENEEGRSEADS